MVRVALVLVFAALFWLPQATDAQAVFRCVGPDGRSVYSDQPCQTQGAVERQAPARPAAASAHGFTTGTGTVAPGCARSLDALLLGVRGSLEARDVNRLATHYHWAGTSARGGRYLMDELEAIVARPLVAIEFVYPQAPDAQAAEPAPAPGRSQPSGERAEVKHLDGDRRRGRRAVGHCHRRTIRSVHARHPARCRGRATIPKATRAPASACGMARRIAAWKAVVS